MSDHRDTAHEHRWWSHIIGNRAHLSARLRDINEWDDDKSVRVEFAVCPCCGGKGSHVNPSIDSHGIGQEEFDEDPDFREDYMSGVYDVACAECGGARVIPICLDEEVQRAIDEDLEASREMRMEYEAERRMGA